MERVIKKQTILTLISLLSAILIVVICNMLQTKQYKEHLSSLKVSMVVDWMVEKNMNALLMNDPGRADLKINNRKYGIDEIIIFNREGEAFAPIEMYGDRLVNSQIIKKVLESKSFHRGGYGEVFAPIRDLGVLYLSLRKENLVSYFLLYISIFFLIAIQILFILISRKDLRSSFNAISNCVAKNFSRLISFADVGVLVLDNEFRVIEINSRLSNVLNFKEGFEGRHLIDLLKGSSQRDLGVKILKFIHDDSILMHGKYIDDYFVRVVSLNSDFSRAKYVIFIELKAPPLRGGVACPPQYLRSGGRRGEGEC